MVKTIWLIEVIMGCALSVAFLVLYAFGSPGWWRWPIGKNLVAKSAVLAIMFLLTGLSAVVRVPAWAFLAGMGVLDGVLVWRLVITWHVQHGASSTSERVPPRG